MMCGFCGSAGFSGCCGQSFYMQSVGEERNDTNVYFCV